MHEDQVERPVAAYLVGEGGPVGRSGVAGLGDVAHCLTVCPPRSACGLQRKGIGLSKDLATDPVFGASANRNRICAGTLGWVWIGDACKSVSQDEELP